ncbi:MAG: hypothetical protein GWO24_17230, partial [Akkermansiaceae bacterium]|nr:hypothetical protein [Akkermansiaceae bacterium]
MKRPTPVLLLGLFAADPISAGPEDYVNFMRQTEYDTLVQWDVPVEIAGTMLSPMEMGSVGSLYEVWSIHSPTADQG